MRASFSTNAEAAVQCSVPRRATAASIAHMARRHVLLCRRGRKTVVALNRPTPNPSRWPLLTAVAVNHEPYTSRCRQCWSDRCDTRRTLLRGRAHHPERACSSRTWVPEERCHPSSFHGFGACHCVVGILVRRTNTSELQAAHACGRWCDSPGSGHRVCARNAGQSSDWRGCNSAGRCDALECAVPCHMRHSRRRASKVDPRGRHEDRWCCSPSRARRNVRCGAVE